MLSQAEEPETEVVDLEPEVKPEDGEATHLALRAAVKERRVGRLIRLSSRAHY